MKRPLALVCLIVLIGWGVEGAEPLEELAERFDTSDSFSRRQAYARFDELVPPDARADALVRLWHTTNEKAARASRNVLGYLVTYSGRQVETTPRIMAMLRQAAGSPNVTTRGVALNVLARRDPSKAEILRFLKDSDDFLRERAIEEIRTRSDARTRLRSYIALNRRNKKWAKSVARAQFFLAQMERNR